MSHEAQAHACAKMANETIVKMLGKGNFGEAYLSDNNNVYKITSDNCEALLAIKIKDSPSEYFAKVHEVKKIGLDAYLIKQEYVDHNSLSDDLYWEISGAADRIGYSIEEIIDEYFDECIDEVDDPSHRAAFEQIKAASDTLRKLGVVGIGVDCQNDNFAVTETGLKFFDCRDQALSQDEAKELILTKYPEVFRKNSQSLDNQYEP